MALFKHFLHITLIGCVLFTAGVSHAQTTEPKCLQHGRRAESVYSIFLSDPLIVDRFNWVRIRCIQQDALRCANNYRPLLERLGFRIAQLEVVRQVLVGRLSKDQKALKKMPDNERFRRHFETGVSLLTEMDTQIAQAESLHDQLLQIQTHGAKNTICLPHKNPIFAGMHQRIKQKGYVLTQMLAFISYYKAISRWYTDE